MVAFRGGGLDTEPSLYQAGQSNIIDLSTLQKTCKPLQREVAAYELGLIPRLCDDLLLCLSFVPNSLCTDNGLANEFFVGLIRGEQPNVPVLQLLLRGPRYSTFNAT